MSGCNVREVASVGGGQELHPVDFSRVEVWHPYHQDDTHMDVLDVIHMKIGVNGSHQIECESTFAIRSVLPIGTSETWCLSHRNLCSRHLRNAQEHPRPVCGPSVLGVEVASEPVAGSQRSQLMSRQLKVLGSESWRPAEGGNCADCCPLKVDSHQPGGPGVSQAKWRPAEVGGEKKRRKNKEKNKIKKSGCPWTEGPSGVRGPCGDLAESVSIYQSLPWAKWRPSGVCESARACRSEKCMARWQGSHWVPVETTANGSFSIVGQNNPVPPQWYRGMWGLKGLRPSSTV